MGSIYKQKLRSGKECAVWWVRYWSNGKLVRESARTEDEKEALRVLKDREGRVVRGEALLPHVDRIKYEEAEKDLVTWYKTTGKRDTVEVEFRLKHLRTFFAGYRIVRIGAAETTQYATKRQEEGASNGTINRELSVLNKMLRLAYKNNKLMRQPVIEKLSESAPRSGFFERDQYEAVRRLLPEDLRVAITVAHTYGWRIRSEVLALKLSQVNLEAGTLTLDPGQTKNRDGRVVYLTPELTFMLRAQVERVKALMRERGAVIPFLFPHLEGRLAGRPRRDFIDTWRTACKNAGCPGMLRHDFRRTAVRNAVNAGVPEKVAMLMTGHKTRSVFDRYHIVSREDLQEATRKIASLGQVSLPHQAAASVSSGVGA